MTGPARPAVAPPTPPSAGRPRRKGIPVWAWVLIAVLGVLFIRVVFLALLAIPTFQVSKKRANEVSAIKSVQTIMRAELEYEVTYPANGFACSLAALGGDPSSGPPSPNSAQLIPADLASGFRQGYEFTLACREKVTSNNVDRYDSFTILARPQTLGKTGDRSYCTDETGQIKYDPAGGTNCTQLVPEQLLHPEQLLQ